MKFSRVINYRFLLDVHIYMYSTFANVDLILIPLPLTTPHRMVQHSVFFLLKKLLICLWLLKPPYLLSCSRYGISGWSKFFHHVLTMCVNNNLFSLVIRMATKLLRLVHDKKKEATEGGILYYYVDLSQKQTGVQSTVYFPWSFLIHTMLSVNIHVHCN